MATKKKSGSKRPTKKKLPKIDRDGVFFNPEYHNLVIIFIGLFLFYALMTNSKGLLPEMSQNIFKGLFGGLAYIVPIIMIVFGVLGLIDGSETIRRVRRTKVYYLIIIYIFIFYGLIHFATLPTRSPLKLPILKDVMKMGVTNEGIGLIPTVITYYLTHVFGVFGTWLVVIFALIISALYVFNISISDIISKAKSNPKLEKADEDAGWHTRFNIFKKNALETISDEVEDDTYANTGFFGKFKSLFTKPDYSDEQTLMADLDGFSDADEEDDGDKTIKIVGFNKSDDDYLEILEGTRSIPMDDLELLQNLQKANQNTVTNSVDNPNFNEVEELDLDGDNGIRNYTKSNFDNDDGVGNLSNTLDGKTLGSLDRDKADQMALLQDFNDVKISQPDKVKKAKKSKKYIKPSVDLLNNVFSKGDDNSKRKIRENADKLINTLNDFGIEAKILQATVGPTITRYEIQPKPGIKVSKIVGLTDDIALSLAAKSIRIVAPIPGKMAIGIEVPNEKASMVGIKDILSSPEFTTHKSNLAFGLGKDVSGGIVVADIADMPHLLIAGSTGSGKSVCINTLISSILFKASPEDVKMIMIDPKMVELANYNGIPHLMLPVVTDPKKAANALNWAVSEMNRRYKLFAENQVKDIKGYNEKISEKMPKIVIIIDELADLMMVSSNDVEASICRLAQMARAAGMHLIVATQRPSVDVITGLIKSNIPTRISFAVSSSTDSRTILDEGGAEKLLGKGDMLYYPVNAAKPYRIQGAFIGEDESERVVDFIKDQYKDVDLEPASEEIMEEINNAKFSMSDDRDEFLDEAINFVVENGQASSSMLQRKFRIGFNRAARIIDSMEEMGIIGQSEGSRPRKVLISKEDLEKRSV